MARIEINDGKFEVAFEALNADGITAPFRSFYAPSGEPIALLKPDTRSASERWGKHYDDYPRSTVKQGIYQSCSMNGYLVFIDKLESELSVFLNWRFGCEDSYHRVAIANPAFHSYGPVPRPNISELRFQSDRFYLAWMTDSRPEADLVLTSLDPRSGCRRDTVVAHKLGLVTLISMDHIEAHGLIVCHRAMHDGEDSQIDVYPVPFQGPT